MFSTEQRGFFASVRKWASGAKTVTETPLFQRITSEDWKKVLANQWNRKKITKKAHAGRGPKTIWGNVQESIAILSKTSIAAIRCFPHKLF